MQKKVFIGSVSDSVNEKIRELSQGKFLYFLESSKQLNGIWLYLLGIRGAVILRRNIFRICLEYFNLW